MGALSLLHNDHIENSDATESTVFTEREGGGGRQGSCLGRVLWEKMQRGCWGRWGMAH